MSKCELVVNDLLIVDVTSTFNILNMYCTCLCTLTFFLSAAPVFSLSSGSVLHERSKRRGTRSAGGIHLPLYRQACNMYARDGTGAVVALGDYIDV